MQILKNAFLGSILLMCAGCQSYDVNRQYFETDGSQPVMRDQLKEIAYDGDFFLLYDRNAKQAFGFANRAKSQSLKLRTVHNESQPSDKFDFGSLCNFRAICGDIESKCKASFKIKNLNKFDEAFWDSKKLGYPVSSMLYIGPDENKLYDVEVSYFDECDHIVNDIDEIKKLF